MTIFCSFAQSVAVQFATIASMKMELAVLAMMTRWMIERKYKNSNHELLQLVEVYAPHENKELVKEENKQWTHERELILVESMKFATDIEGFK